MTTNQTIDGVPRGLLEALVSIHPSDMRYRLAKEDLRALMDAPDDCRCRRFGKDNPHWPCPVHSAPAAQPQGEPVELAVWYGPMPESNGKTNWTAILHRKGECMSEGITIDRSEYPDRVRYEADRILHLIGVLKDEPDILAYDPDKHSGYVKAEQPAPLKIGRGVTVRNIGFGSDEERKPYLVFADNVNLTEVNLVDVSMISRLRTYTLKQLEELGVRVEQPASVAVPVDDNVEFEKWWMSTPILRKQKIQIAQEAWFARANLSK